MIKINLSYIRKILLLAVALFTIYYLPITNFAHAAVLYTGSANQVVYEGESFLVEWYLDTQDKEINSLSLNLTYSKDKLEVLEASAGNSILDLWIKTPEINQEKGEIKLVGGISGGIKNSRLPVFRTTFKPIATGDAKLSMSTSSEVLLADGAGTSAGLIFTEVKFVVNPIEAKPAQIASPTHPDQDAWHKNKNVNIKVENKPGEIYSYSFSSNIEIIPDQNPDNITQPLIFNDLPDGIYYFKLNSKTGSANWQEAGVYHIKIDTTPPRDFKPAFGKDPSVFEGQPFLSFNAVDSVSGVAYYEIKSSPFSGWEKTENSYFKLPGTVLGNKIEVKVVDAAGNEKIMEIKVDNEVLNSVFYNPIIWVIIGLIFIIVVILIWYYFKLLKKYKV
jgi:hypothetical protein